MGRVNFKWFSEKCMGSNCVMNNQDRKVPTEAMQNPQQLADSIWICRIPLLCPEELPSATSPKTATQSKAPAPPLQPALLPRSPKRQNFTSTFSPPSLSAEPGHPTNVSPSENAFFITSLHQVGLVFLNSLASLFQRRALGWVFHVPRHSSYRPLLLRLPGTEATNRCQKKKLYFWAGPGKPALRMPAGIQESWFLMSPSKTALLF